MKKFRITIKKSLLKLLKKEIIPFEDDGKSTELHCYKLFGVYIKITQYIKPIDPNDEQCDYLGITYQDRYRRYKPSPQFENLGYNNHVVAQMS